MAGYERVFNKGPGDRIDADLFNDEYQSLDSAFDAAIGHRHNGQIGGAPYIQILSGLANTNEIIIDEADNALVFSTNLSGNKTEQLRIINGAITLSTNNHTTIGSITSGLKDLHLKGTANIANLKLSSGVSVLSILDEDNMASDSELSLATQQSIKAYTTSSVFNHIHDGVSSSFIPILANPNSAFKSQIETLGDNVVVSVRAQPGDNIVSEIMTLTGTSVLPGGNDVISLGSATRRWKELFISGATIHIGNMKIKTDNSTNTVRFLRSDGLTLANIEGNLSGDTSATDLLIDSGTF